MSPLPFSDHLLILYALSWAKILECLTLEDLVVQPQIHPKWTSQIFALPVEHLYYIPHSWLNCRKINNYYCLVAYETEYDNYLPAFTPFHNNSFNYLRDQFNLESNVHEACTPKLRGIYRLHNSYSDTGGCCYRQCSSYFYKGYTKSMLTIDEYIEKLTNYKDENKKLNAIWSYFEPSCRVNIITKLGFGTGSLKKYSTLPGDQFFADNFAYQMKIGLAWSERIPANSLKRFLTYSWFKQNVICKSQPWICITWS